MKESSKTYWSCWVCSRQHHSSCVGQERFICAACQKRTLDKSIGAGNYLVVNVGGLNHADSGYTWGPFSSNWLSLLSSIGIKLNIYQITDTLDYQVLNTC